jgi:hypothetical protein
VVSGVVVNCVLFFWELPEDVVVANPDVPRRCYCFFPFCCLLVLVWVDLIDAG